MKKLLAIAADGLAGVNDVIAHRADHLRTLGVVNATVGTEDDVLTGLDSQPTQSACGQFRCHEIRLHQAQRGHRHDSLVSPSTGFPTSAPGAGPTGIWLDSTDRPRTTRTKGVQMSDAKDEQDEKTLRDKARAAIRGGKLPRRAPDRTWGGPGVGAGCAVCGRPVTTGEMEFEIRFAHDGGSPGLEKFHVHIRCFAAWEFERRDK
jgi:hypothetical protein